MDSPLDPHQIARNNRLVEKFRLPPGKSCKDCLNFHVWCVDVLAGEKPMDPLSTFCGWSENKFGIDIREPSEFVRNLRKKR